MAVTSYAVALPPQTSEAQLASTFTNLKEVSNESNPNEELLRELDNLLQSMPDHVRLTIRSLINQEIQRSYQNVVDQIRSFKVTLEKVVALDTSEDMQNLRQMLQQLKDSDLRALEREASNIDSHASIMVRCIQERDFASLKQMARCLENNSERFIEKYNRLSTLLQKLAERCEALQKDFCEGKQKSYLLKKETEDRRDWYFRLFAGIGFTTGAVSVIVVGVSVHTCIGTIMAMKAAHVKAAQALHELHYVHHAESPWLWSLRDVQEATAAGTGAAASGLAYYSGAGVFGAVGIGAAVAIIIGSGAAALPATASSATAAYATAQATLSSGAATLAVYQPIAITSGVIAALFLLGCAGRKKLKSLLGNLWKKEIETHLQTAEAFEALEQHLCKVAEELRHTETINTRLLDALEFVRETAQEMAERAEDAEMLNPPAGVQAERTLERHVEELSGIVNTLRDKTMYLLPAVIEMQTHLKSERPQILPGSLPISNGDDSDAQTSNRVAIQESVDQGLITYQPSHAQSLTPTRPVGDVKPVASSSNIHDGFDFANQASAATLPSPVPESSGTSSNDTEGDTWEILTVSGVQHSFDGSWGAEGALEEDQPSDGDSIWLFPLPSEASSYAGGSSQLSSMS